MTVCEICNKKPQKGFNKPYSLHRTKRLIKPNIQKNKHGLFFSHSKIMGKKICTRCLRTQNTILKKSWLIWFNQYFKKRRPLACD